MMNEQNGDQRLRCLRCGQVFAWTAESQRFFESNQWPAPIRCAECRRTAKAERAQRGEGW